MQDEALRARCSAEAARLSAETFVWDHEAEKYVDLYERTLAPLAARAEDKKVGRNAA